MPIFYRKLKLRIPQLRVLGVLLPDDSSKSALIWPAITTNELAKRIGVSTISDSIRRAMRGLPKGSSSGEAHPGLLALGLAEELVYDVDGRREVAYRATPTGIVAYRRHIAAVGELPPLKDKASSVNTKRGYDNPHAARIEK